MLLQSEGIKETGGNCPKSRWMIGTVIPVTEEIFDGTHFVVIRKS